MDLDCDSVDLEVGLAEKEEWVLWGETGGRAGRQFCAKAHVPVL